MTKLCDDKIKEIAACAILGKLKDLSVHAIIEAAWWVFYLKTDKTQIWKQFERINKSYLINLTEKKKKSIKFLNWQSYQKAHFKVSNVFSQCLFKYIRMAVSMNRKVIQGTIKLIEIS